MFNDMQNKGGDYIYIYIYIYIYSFVLYFIKASISVLQHFITSFLSPDDGLLKPKRYDFDFLLNSSPRIISFLIFLSTLSDYFPLFTSIYIYMYA